MIPVLLPIRPALAHAASSARLAPSKQLYHVGPGLIVSVAVQNPADCHWHQSEASRAWAAADAGKRRSSLDGWRCSCQQVWRCAAGKSHHARCSHPSQPGEARRGHGANWMHVLRRGKASPTSSPVVALKSAACVAAPGAACLRAGTQRGCRSRPACTPGSRCCRSSGRGGCRGHQGHGGGGGRAQQLRACGGSGRQCRPRSKGGGSVAASGCPCAVEISGPFCVNMIVARCHQRQPGSRR